MARARARRGRRAGPGSGPADGEQARRAELISRLAHDVRAPLGVVSSAFAELSTAFASQLTDEQRTLGGLAERGLRRLLRLADRLALLAGLEGGPFELNQRALDLGQLVRASVEAAVGVEVRRDVELACELPAEPCSVRADEERLLRALVELIGNAVRHARGQVRVRLEAADGHLRVLIEDDGEGVPAAIVPTLFERFQPGAPRSGLGIGVSIARDVVSAHGGRLEHEPSSLPPGRPGTVGARFVVTLPTRH